MGGKAVKVDQLNLYVTNASGNARLGIYSDSAGSPDMLLAQLPDTAPSTPTSPSVTYSIYAKGKDSSGEVHVGLDAIVSREDTPATNFFLATKVTPVITTTVNQLNLFIKNATGNGRLGLYTDSSGRPGTLIAQTGEITLINGWNSGRILDTTVLSGSSLVGI